MPVQAPGTSNDDKWADLTGFVQLGVAVAAALSLHDQAEQIQATSTFIARRQPVSRCARETAAYDLRSDSGSESVVDTASDSDYVTSDDDDASETSQAENAADADYCPSDSEAESDNSIYLGQRGAGGSRPAPRRTRRIVPAIVVAATGRRSLAEKSRWKLDVDAVRAVHSTPPTDERPASDPPRERRSTRRKRQRTPSPDGGAGPSTPAPTHHDSTSKYRPAEGALAVPSRRHTEPPRGRPTPSREAHVKGTVGRWLDSLPASRPSLQPTGGMQLPTHADSEDNLPSGSVGRGPIDSTPREAHGAVLTALPLVGDPDETRRSRRRGKGRAKLPRKLQQADMRAHTLARDAARRDRSAAIANAAQKAQVKARAMSPVDRQWHQLHGRAAHRIIEQLAAVRSTVKITGFMNGRSFFVGPSTYKEGKAEDRGDGGPRVPLDSKCNRLVRKLVRRDGYTYVANDATRAQACFDGAGKMFAVKAQPPTGAWYQDAIAAVTRLATDLREALRLADLSPNSGRNTRGKFSRFTYGTSFGGGQKEPTRISPDCTAHNEQLIIEFLTNDKVRRVLQHVEFVALFYPELAAMYRKVQATIKVPDVLRRAGVNLPFAAHTFNLGPYVACWFHRDARNFLLGICPVLVLGDFDHRTSGHFIMVEPKIVMELRAGDLLLMMSAVLTHGNAPLRAGETRMSWTFFTAGGLFRWMAAGCKLVGELSDEEFTEYAAAASDLLRDAWDAVPTLDMLQSRVNGDRT